MTRAVSEPVYAPPPFVFATLSDIARLTTVPLVVVVILTVFPLLGMTVKGPAVVDASPSERIDGWVNPGVVTTTAALL